MLSVMFIVKSFLLLQYVYTYKECVSGLVDPSVLTHNTTQQSSERYTKKVAKQWKLFLYACVHSPAISLGTPVQLNSIQYKTALP